MRAGPTRKAPNRMPAAISSAQSVLPMRRAIIRRSGSSRSRQGSYAASHWNAAVALAPWYVPGVESGSEATNWYVCCSFTAQLPSAMLELMEDSVLLNLLTSSVALVPPQVWSAPQSVIDRLSWVEIAGDTGVSVSELRESEKSPVSVPVFLITTVPVALVEASPGFMPEAERIAPGALLLDMLIEPAVKVLLAFAD